MATQSTAVRALRGAIGVERNEAQAILGATTELMGALLERNGLAPADLISCIFTLTEDLDAAFPAQAARALGLTEVPLLCAREIPVPGATPRIVRVLIHFNAVAERPVQHVYLGAAGVLREDLAGAQ